MASTASTSRAGSIRPGSKATVAVSVARFTEALTPSRPLRLLATRAAHEAQVIPSIGRSSRSGRAGRLTVGSRCVILPLSMADLTSPTPGYSVAGAKDDVLRRLRRIEGQVRGIAGMVEDERYCIDVLQQISAAQAALDKVALALVDDHTRYCVLGADPENQEEKREELMTALARLVGRR